jgi:hypothetical protein
MSEQSKIERVPVCPKCGSDNVVADAAARWDVKSQAWIVANSFDKGHNCNDCGAEDIDFKWTEENVIAVITHNSSQLTRPLNDIDVREEENEEGRVDGCGIEFATFSEGEYVESISIDRVRATQVYQELGKLLRGTPSERETATILAALRFWQREGAASAGRERDIETDGGRFEPLSAEEVDALCECINGS